MPQFAGLIAVAVSPISRCKGVPVADRYTSRFGCPVFLGLFGSAKRSGSPTNCLAHGHAGSNGYSITRANAHTVPNARHPANNRAHRLADALANLYISASPDSIPNIYPLPDVHPIAHAHAITRSQTNANA